MFYTLILMDLFMLLCQGRRTIPELPAIPRETRRSGNISMDSMAATTHILSRSSFADVEIYKVGGEIFRIGMRIDACMGYKTWKPQDNYYIIITFVEKIQICLSKDGDYNITILSYCWCLEIESRRSLPLHFYRERYI